MLKYVSKISKNVYKVSVLNDVGKIGSVNMGICKSKCIIYNIHVEECNRCKGYGSLLLEYVERKAVSKYNVSKMEVLVHNPILSNMCLFYISNGYSICNAPSPPLAPSPPHSVYDKEEMYELIHMEKTLCNN